MDALSSASDEQLKDALEWCVKNGGEWPPSLPTFRSLCLGVQGEAAERARQSKGLPPPAAFPEADGSDPVARQFALEHRKTNERIRERYGNAPDGGYRDFLDQCELNGMKWAAKHFTRAEA